MQKKKAKCSIKMIELLTRYKNTNPNRWGSLEFIARQGTLKMHTQIIINNPMQLMFKKIIFSKNDLFNDKIGFNAPTITLYAFKISIWVGL